MTSLSNGKPPVQIGPPAAPNGSPLDETRSAPRRHRRAPLCSSDETGPSPCHPGACALQQILQFDYRNRPVAVSAAVFAPGTSAGLRWPRHGHRERYLSDHCLEIRFQWPRQLGTDPNVLQHPLPKRSYNGLPLRDRRSWARTRAPKRELHLSGRPRARQQGARREVRAASPASGKGVPRDHGRAPQDPAGVPRVGGFRSAAAERSQPDHDFRRLGTVTSVWEAGLTI